MSPRADAPDPRQLFFWLLVGLLSLMQFHLYLELHRNNAALLAQRTIDILDGRPYWRAYQNRILGPWLVRVLGHVIGSDGRAFLVFAGASLFTTNTVAGALARIHLRRPFAAAVALCLFALFYVLLFGSWSYPWDFIETITFMLFSHVVLARRSVLWVLPIFVVAVLNRESSLFIGAWFLIAPAVRKLLDRRAPLRYREIAFGLLLTAVAAAFTIGTRRWLFESSPVEPAAGTNLIADNVVAISYNLAIVHAGRFLGFGTFLACVAFVYFYGRGSRSPDGGNRAVDLAFSVLIGLVLLQLLVFAVLDETRVFYTVLAMIYVAGLRRAAGWTELAAVP